ncbi:Zinc finger C3H1 domain-containing protein, variant 4 [Chamberlinius hualienensis]
MVNICNEDLDMEDNYRARSEGDWSESKVRHELEEGEIDEEDEDIYVLAEFDRRERNGINVNVENRVVKEDIDERIPFVMNCNSNERHVIRHNMTRNVSPKAEIRVQPQQQRAYDRDERHPRNINRPRGYRGNRLRSNVRNNTNRPHMSGYSLRRQTILRSIFHRKSKATTSYDVGSNRSYDDLLAEYKDIKSQLKDLSEEQYGTSDGDIESNEGSYGDKENRIYRRNSSTRLPKVENRHESSRHLRKSSKSTESLPPVVEETRKESEEDEATALRKLALASYFKVKQNSKLVPPTLNETLTPSSEAVIHEETDDSTNKLIANSVDVEEDEDLLRAQLLSSLTLKQLDKSSSVNSNFSDVNVSIKLAESVLGDKSAVEDGSVIFKFPVHQPVVINLKDDSDSDDDLEAEIGIKSQNKIASLDSIDDFLRAARNLSDVSITDSKPSPSTLTSTPSSVLNLPAIELKEYNRLKAVIANREQSKKCVQSEKIDNVKISKTGHGNLILAEGKCLKSRQLLSVQETELSKLTEDLATHDKALKATSQKICGLEKQLASAKKLELLQKQRYSELNAKKLALEVRVKASRTDNLKLQVACVELGKSVVGNSYKFPETDAVLRKATIVPVVMDKKPRIPIRKLKTPLSSTVNNQSVNKRSAEFAAELRRKQQLIVAQIADLRKKTIKASRKKSATTSTKMPITITATSASVSTETNQTASSVGQQSKRIRRQSVTKKAKRLRLSESETSTKTEITKPSVLSTTSSTTVSSNANNISSSVIKGDTISNADICVNVDSVFEFNRFFTNDTPKLDATDTAIGKVTVTNEIIPEAFLPYRSPLLAFRSYRFSPYFRTKSNRSLTWPTHCHAINPKVYICRYDLTGKCNDDKCKWQHSSNYIVSHEQCLKDIISYAPQIIERNTDIKESRDANKKIDIYVANFIRSNHERMTHDELCVLLVGKINEYLNKDPPHYITFEEKPKRFSKAKTAVDEASPFTFEFKIKDDDRCGFKMHLNTDSDPDDICDESYIRYFDCDLQNLNSNQMQPIGEAECIALAKSKFNAVGRSPSLCLDLALNVLVRALEDPKNTKSSKLWSFYLSLYVKHQNCSDLMLLFEQAIRLAPSYEIYWQYLQSRKEFSEKEKLLEKIMSFLVESKDANGVQPHEIFEILCYWVKLYVSTGNFDHAIRILEETLHILDSFSSVRKIFEHMTTSDRCLVWLCYISLKVFHSLPESLFSSENSGLGKVVSKNSFILPWKSKREWHLKETEILDLFAIALKDCAREDQTVEENTRLCLPVYKNLIVLKMNKQRSQLAVDVCKQLISKTSCEEALLVQACTYYHLEYFEDLRKMLNSVLSENSTSPIFYSFAIMYEIKNQNVSGALTLCLKCLSSLYEHAFENLEDIDSLFRKLLNLPDENKSLNASYPRPPKSISHIAHVWLIYCLFLSTQEKFSEVITVFEQAIARSTNKEDLEMLWLHYLDACFQQPLSVPKLFGLINRCLNSVPCKVTLPGSSGDITHISYAFFNLVLHKCISSLEVDVQILIMERFLNFSTSNSKLAVRLLTLYLNQNEIQLAWKLCCSQLERTPRNLDLWKIALKLACKNRPPNEIRSMFRLATRALPYSRFLWRKFVEFETFQGEFQKANDLVTECRQFGIKTDFVKLDGKSKN